MKYCFGIDVGGTTVKMGLFEETGKILDKWEIVTRTEEEGKAILPDISASILEKIEEKGLKKDDIAVSYTHLAGREQRSTGPHLRIPDRKRNNYGKRVHEDIP